MPDKSVLLQGDPEYNSATPACLPGDGFWPRLWLRVGISLVLAGQGMVFGLGLNTADPPLAPTQPIYWLLHIGLLVSALVPLALLGGPLFRETGAALRSSKITIEALFTLSVVGALIGSLVSSVRGSGAVYYEVVAIVLAIYSVGKALGVRSKARAQIEARKLELILDYAVVEHGTELKRLPLSALKDDSVVVVAPGEPIPIDGTVSRGQALVQEQPLTGEPSPVERTPGSRVLAGTHPVDGTLYIRPERFKGQRRYDEILAAVADAREKPTRLQADADRLTRYFVPVVSTVSLGTFILWLPFADWMTALFNAMAVLIVACPCALGLATPAAVWNGLATLARLGLVARQGDVLESLARARCFVFDKTGTLSLDRLVVGSVELSEDWENRRSQLASALLKIEAPQSHPVAHALSEWALDQKPISAYKVENMQLIPAQGIQADLSKDSGEVESWRIGSAAFALDHSEKLSEPNTLFVSVSGKTVACFKLQESLRANAEWVFTELEAEGAEAFAILSGDPAPAWKELDGVQVEAGMTPMEKVRRVKELREGASPLIFVGDGLNDAPAMAEADVGIALDHGASLSQASADAVLLGGNLSALPVAKTFSMQLMKTVRSNLRFALIYNVIGMGLAAGGILHPVVAALLMLGSSVLVSGRILRAANIE